MLTYLNELSIFRGDPIVVGKGVSVHQPTLGEIEHLGEDEYFNVVRTITATPSDMIYQLTQMGVDFTKISAYEMFYSMIYPMLTPDRTVLLFGTDFDFTELKLHKNETTNEFALMNDDESIFINKPIYDAMTETICKIHGLTPNLRTPANNAAKQGMIEDAEEAYFQGQKKEFTSTLLPMISSMVVTPGFKHDEVTVFDMKIGAFIDAVKRSSHNRRADTYLQSGYSGFGISLKDIDSNDINYFSRLND